MNEWTGNTDFYVEIVIYMLEWRMRKCFIIPLQEKINDSIKYEYFQIDRLSALYIILHLILLFCLRHDES